MEALSAELDFTKRKLVENEAEAKQKESSSPSTPSYPDLVSPFLSTFQSVLPCHVQSYRAAVSFAQRPYPLFTMVQIVEI